jgi:hypothetical protein
MIARFQRFIKALFGSKPKGHAYTVNGWARRADGTYRHPDCPDIEVYRGAGFWVWQEVGDESTAQRYPSLRAAIGQKESS